MVVAHNNVFFKDKHGNNWWQLRRGNTFFPTKKGTCLIPGNQWKQLFSEQQIAELNEQETNLASENLHGETKFRCEDSDLFPATDFPNSQHVCQLTLNCHNVSAWRCPHKHCKTAVCRKHFKNKLQNFNMIPVTGKTNKQKQLN